MKTIKELNEEFDKVLNEISDDEDELICTISNTWPDGNNDYIDFYKTKDGKFYFVSERADNEHEPVYYDTAEEAEQGYLDLKQGLTVEMEDEDE